MKKINIGGKLSASAIALGCMRYAGMEPKAAAELLNTAVEAGIDFFDHADIYGGGKSEEVFARALKDTGINRDSLVIQTKCSIRPGNPTQFDFSKEHIISSVEGSLKRLQLDYVDVLLLHRPDTLVEPEEVAEAFSSLEKSGKVKYFGVSNQKPMMIELLKTAVKQPLIANQLQLSVLHTGMMDSGLNVNMKNEPSVDHDGSILEYSRIHSMTIQPWSPFQWGMIQGTFMSNPDYPEINAKLEEMGKAKGISASAMAIAWLLRHPAKMQPIVGSTNAQRVKEIAKAADITLSRLEWYDIYRAAGNQLP